MGKGILWKKFLAIWSFWFISMNSLQSFTFLTNLDIFEIEFQKSFSVCHFENFQTILVNFWVNLDFKYKFTIQLSFFLLSCIFCLGKLYHSDISNSILSFLSLWTHNSHLVFVWLISTGQLFTTVVDPWSILVYHTGPG